MKTKQYLDAVKAKLGISSDYALQKPLQLSKQGVSYLVNGGVMSTTTAAKVAGILELEPLQVIADAELERGTAPDLWKRIRAAAAIVGGIGGAVLLAHLARSSGADAQQALEAYALLASTVQGPVYYVNFPPDGGLAIAIAAVALAGVFHAFAAVHKQFPLSQRPA